MGKSARIQNATVIKVEGIDGCGKTSLVSSLAKRYSEQHKVVAIKEYGSSQDKFPSFSKEFTVSQILRQLAKSTDSDVDDIERQLLWVMASRRTNRLVIPELSRNHELLLVDRSSLSNLAYGMVIEPRLEFLYKIASTSVETADIIFWLDTPVEICYQRLTSRQNEDIIDNMQPDFLSAVRANYLELSKTNPNIFVLDGALDLEGISNLARERIDGKVNIQT